MKISEVVIAWTANRSLYADTPTRGRVMVAPVSEHGRLRRDGFVTTDGGCISYNIGLDKTSRQHLAMSIALGMILRDGLDAAEVHRAMWQIEDYRNGVPRDTPPPTDTPAPPWY